MKFIIDEPTKARLEFDSKHLVHIQKALAYQDKSIKFQYEKLKKNSYQAQFNPNYFADLQSLRDSINQNLLKEDDEGYYTYSGLYTSLKTYMAMYDESVEYINNIEYPESKLIPYDLRYSPVKPRYYQQDAVDALLSGKHCHISLSTGSGKSLAIQLLCKKMGLKSLVITPTTSIAHQIYDQFLEAFGPKYVGMYGDGKKKLDKLFTIAIAASLVRIEDDDTKSKINENKVLIVDESHVFASDTLSTLSLGLCKDIPYRWFVSATQFRNDGRDLLLDSIIGPQVYSKNFKELVDEGFLADLEINILIFDTLSEYSNPNNSKRSAQEHLLYNPLVIKNCANLVNQCLDKDEPVVILVDEFEQINSLKPHLRYTADIATSQTDVSAIVKKFNFGNSKFIIGTSAIAVGTDIKPVKHLFLLNYGSSEIQKKQAIGRATRLSPGKNKCAVYDFNSVGGAGVHHVRKKIDMYRSLGVTVHVINNAENG